MRKKEKSFNGKDCFPLTDIQQAYLMGRDSNYFDLGPVGSFIYFENKKRNINVLNLEMAINILIKRHDMLRAVFSFEGTQKILDSVNWYKIKVTNFSSLSTQDALLGLAKIKKTICERVRPVDQWPFFEISISKMPDGEDVVHFYVDLLIADGSALNIIFQELSLLYCNQNAKLPKLTTNYINYIVELEQFKLCQKYKEAEIYWKNRISTLPPSPSLPLRKKKNFKPHFTRRSFFLSKERWDFIKQKSASLGVTPAVFICTVYSEVLFRWSKEDRFTLNLMFFNRTSFDGEIDSVIGNFSSTTLLEIGSSQGRSFKQIAQEIQKQLWNDLEHSSFNGVRVLQEINRLNGGANSAGMPIVFACTLNLAKKSDFLTEEEEKNSTFFQWYGQLAENSSIYTPYVWIDHQIFEDYNGNLCLNLDTLDDLFPEKMIAEIFSVYKEILFSHDSWDEIPFNLWKLARSEKFFSKNIINKRASLLHEKFLKNVERSSTKVAIINGNLKLSYEELSKISLYLAESLKSLGINANHPIAIIMNKGWEQVAGVLGILIAGCFYIPIDADWPEERIKQILKSSQAKAVVIQDHLIKMSHLFIDIPVLVLKESFKSIKASFLPDLTQNPNDLAYVIFTSGSTGVPKGVMIEHLSAVNTIEDINQRFQVSEKDSILCLSSLSFDLSVYDIFGLLSVGGTLIIPDFFEQKDSNTWVRLIDRYNISIWNTAPALMTLLIDTLDPEYERNSKLRLVLLSGDWIPLNLPNRIKAHYLNSRVVSLGGATEASIWSIFHIIESVDLSLASIPYGRSLDNQEVSVRKQDFSVCPTWVVGEIYISGLGLARGYWDDEFKTNSSFVKHIENDKRFYKTGDLGRYLPNGEIEFLGRKDDQVKIQGYRIELGEIESVISKHSSVASVVVKASGNIPDKRYLVAYVTLKSLNHQINDKDFINKELRMFTESKLPKYMVPKLFLILDSIPITLNGKVDYKRLSQLLSVEEKNKIRTFVPAETALEKELVGLWKKILNLEHVGVEDNFFDLGGQSFLAFQMMNKINKKYKISIPVTSLFNDGNIRGLALSIQKFITSQNNEKHQEEIIIQLQSEGSNIPLFFVHPSGGNVFCYNELARSFKNFRPFFGLQSVMLSNFSINYLSIEKMAEIYLKAILERQNGNKFILGGWSLGGIIAFEMAKQLKKNNKLINPVILIDSPAPYLRAQPKESYLKDWFEKDIGPSLENFDEDQIKLFYKVFCSNIKALFDYRSEKTDISVAVLKAAQINVASLAEHPWSKELDWGWSKITNQIEHVENINCDHYSIFSGSHLQQLISWFNYLTSLKSFS